MGKYVPKIRWLLLVFAAGVVAVWFYAYYNHLIRTRREFLLNNAFASLSVAADEFSARVSNWRVVVTNARTRSGGDQAEFVKYIRLLVPGLNACSQGSLPSVNPTATSIKQAPTQLEQRATAVRKASTDVSVENASSTLRTLRFRAVAYAGERSGMLRRVSCSLSHFLPGPHRITPVHVASFPDMYSQDSKNSSRRNSSWAGSSCCFTKDRCGWNWMNK